MVSVSGRAAAASAKVSVWGRGRVCQWAGGGVAAAVTRRRRSGAAVAARWRGGSVSQQGGECQRAGSAAAAAARRRGRSMLERGGECQPGVGSGAGAGAAALVSARGTLLAAATERVCQVKFQCVFVAFPYFVLSFRCLRRATLFRNPFEKVVGVFKNLFLLKFSIQCFHRFFVHPLFCVCHIFILFLAKSSASFDELSLLRTFSSSVFVDLVASCSKNVLFW